MNDRERDINLPSSGPICVVGRERERCIEEKRDGAS